LREIASKRSIFHALSSGLFLETLIKLQVTTTAITNSLWEELDRKQAADLGFASVAGLTSQYDTLTFTFITIFGLSYSFAA
jgi:hypothetical protein